ncbi:MAG: hypothetical protein N3D10_03160 [Candidatus Micrarchaeota archaeon]|nr:hypothetical protein [Candidatus Micrarchaeota archaeon]
MSYSAKLISQAIEKNVEKINILEKQTKDPQMLFKLTKLKQAFYELGSRHISSPSLSFEVFGKTYKNLEDLLHRFEEDIKRQNFSNKKI